MSNPARSSHRVALVLAAAVACSVALRADTVTLTSGKVMEDVTVKEEGDKVRLTKLDGSSSIWPKSMIKSIEKKKMPAEELADRRKALDAKDVKGRMDLARWCDEKKLAKEALELWKEVLGMDPASEEAHKSLGHVLLAGTWYESVTSAFDDFNRAGKARSSDDFLALGEACKRLGQKAVLQKTAKAALGSHPESKEAWTKILDGTGLRLTKEGDVIDDSVQVVSVSTPKEIQVWVSVDRGVGVGAIPEPSSVSPPQGSHYVVVQLSLVGRLIHHEEALGKTREHYISKEFKLLAAGGATISTANGFCFGGSYQVNCSSTTMEFSGKFDPSERHQFGVVFVVKDSDSPVSFQYLETDALPLPGAK